MDLTSNDGLFVASGDGLSVSYDEEKGVISFDWDPETHPEYNYLEGLTAEELVNMVLDYINKKELNGEESISTEV